MSDRWQEVAAQRDLVFSRLAMADGFIGAGITLQGGGPNLLVFSLLDEAATKAVIKSKVGGENTWVETINVMRLKVPPETADLPLHRPHATLAGRVKSLAHKLKIRLAGIEVGDGTMIGPSSTYPTGTVGCVLLDASGIPYYLTAGHIFPPLQPSTPPPLAYLNSGSNLAIGAVLAVSNLPKLDWALIAADPQAATPASALHYDSALGAPLTGPMPAAAVRGLVNTQVAISTQRAKGRSTGTVISIGTNLKVPQASEQIVVKSDPGDPYGDFGHSGDSGAVAYLTRQFGAYGSGTAIGLYWFIDTMNQLHLLAPLNTLLTDIESYAQANNLSVQPPLSLL